MSIFNRSIIFLCCIHTVTMGKTISLSTNNGKYINAEIIELSLIFNRFLKKWMYGTPKTPFIFNNTPHTITTLSELEKNTTISKQEILQLSFLLYNVKEKFISKTKKFIDCSRIFANILYTLTEEDCKKRNRKNSFLRRWITSDTHKAKKIFITHINSFTMLKELCNDLLYLLSDLIYSCPETLHKFELRIKKIKKLKEVLPKALLFFHDNDNAIINQKNIIATFKQKELAFLSLDEITPEQIRIIIEKMLLVQK